MNLKKGRDLVLLYSSISPECYCCHSVPGNIFLSVHITSNFNSCFWYSSKTHFYIFRILLLECSSLTLLCYLAHPLECYYLTQASTPLTLSPRTVHHVNYLLGRRS